MRIIFLRLTFHDYSMAILTMMYVYVRTHTHTHTQIRRPIGTTFELIIPPLAALFIIGLRYVGGESLSMQHIVNSI